MKLALLLLVAGVLLAQIAHRKDGKVRIFLPPDYPNTTAELKKQCSGVLIVNRIDAADFSIRANAFIGGFFRYHLDFGVFDKSGDPVFNSTSGRLKKDVKRFCESTEYQTALKDAGGMK